MCVGLGGGGRRGWVLLNFLTLDGLPAAAAQPAEGPGLLLHKQPAGGICTQVDWLQPFGCFDLLVTLNSILITLNNWH